MWKYWTACGLRQLDTLRIGILAGTFLETLGLPFVELAAWCLTVSCAAMENGVSKDGTKPL